MTCDGKGEMKMRRSCGRDVQWERKCKAEVVGVREEGKGGDDDGGGDDPGRRQVERGDEGEKASRRAGQGRVRLAAPAKERRAEVEAETEAEAEAEGL
ncbi:hypothetical protein L1887_51729 [Cichorium endivia]|nr:hypothetical protein L1887_51729 [Cichorium endivia]